MLTTYLNFPVFDFVARETLPYDISNNYELVGESFQRQIKFEFEPTLRIFNFTLLQASRESARTIREFFNARKGRLYPFWIRSKKADYKLMSPASVGVSNFSILACQSTFGVVNVTRHIYIPKLNQATKITNIVDDGGGIYNVGLSGSLSGSLIAGDTCESFYLVRFASDALKLELPGINEDVTKIEFKLIELQGETP